MKSFPKLLNWNSVLLLITLLVFLIFFKKLFLPELSIYATPDLGRSEIWSLNYPLKDFLSRSLKSLELPFWSKNVGGGYPVFAEGLIGTLYIPNLILFGLLPTPLAWNMSYVFTFILIFAGTYLFIYKNSKNRTSAVYGALVFTFCGYNVVHIPHYPLIQAIGLLPLILFVGQNMTENPSKKNIFILSLLLSQQLFIGHPQVTFITLLLVTVITFFIIKPGLRRPKYTGYIPLIKAVIFGLLFSAPQLLPSLELLPLTITGARGLGLLSEITKFPYLPRYLLSFISPDLFGTFSYDSLPSLQNGNSIYWEVNSYIGLIPVILAVFAIYKSKRGKIKSFLIASLTVSLFIMFSYIYPFKILFLLPGFNLFRVTSRFLLIGVFTLSVLAGYGLKEIALKPKNIFIKNFIYIFVFTFTLIPLLKFGTVYNPTVKFSEFLKTPKITDHITRASRVIDDTSIYADWNDSLKKLSRNDISPLLFHLNTENGYLPLMQNIANADSEISAPLLRQTVLLKYPDYALMGANSVDYLISARKLPNESPLKSFKVLHPDNIKLNDLYIYKNKDVLPRFRLVSDYEVKPFDYKLPDWHFSKTELNFANAAILENDPGMKFEKPDHSNIDILTDEDNKTILNVKTDRRSLLIAADTNYPGWTVWVNGKKSKIMNANFNQRAMVVPAGDNLVTLKFIPYSFYVGVAVLILSILYFYKRKIKFSLRSS